MESWKSASVGDRELFDVISAMFVGNTGLITFLFDSQLPELNGSSRDVLAAAKGLCSGDYLLIRAALDLWSGSGTVTLHEVLDADHEIGRLIAEAMTRLRPA